MITLNLDFIETLTLASILYWLGVTLCRRLKLLGRYNIPPAIVGGLLFALLRAALVNTVSFKFDLVLMQPFMVVFFATIGLGASASLLRRGGGVAFKLCGWTVSSAAAERLALGIGRLAACSRRLRCWPVPPP